MSVVKGAPDDWRLNIYRVLLILGKRRHQSRSANAVLDGNRKLSLSNDMVLIEEYANDKVRGAKPS